MTCQRETITNIMIKRLHLTCCRIAFFNIRSQVNCILFQQKYLSKHFMVMKKIPLSLFTLLFLIYIA